MRHKPRCGLRDGEREHRGRAHPIAHVEPSYGHIHQAKPWQTVGFMRLCGSKYRQQLRHRSEEHTSELQSRQYLVCRLLLEKKKTHDLQTRLSLLSILATIPSLPLC